MNQNENRSLPPSERSGGRWLRTILVVLVVFCLGLSLWAGFLAMRAAEYRHQLENAYMRDIDQVCDDLTNLSSDLVKSLYSGTPAQLSLVSAKMWKEASSAKESLAGLPSAQLGLDGTYRFLSQVGDYALSLSKKSMQGQPVSEEEYQQLLSLREYADRLSSQVDSLQQRLRSGELSLDRLIRSADRSQTAQRNNFSVTVPAEASTDQPVTEKEAQAASEATPVQEAGNEELAAMEKGFTGYPSLIYDGPFSDHLLDRTPLLTEGQPTLSVEEARAIAARWTGVEESALPNMREENSPCPCYVFYDAERFSVAVSKQGGYLVYLIRPGTPAPEAAATLSREDAVAKAQAYLAENGLTSMEATYYEEKDGRLTINFAYFDPEAQVLCYTDLVKVEVALQNGEILSCDARGYVMNHHDRTFEAPALSPKEAQASVSQNLNMERVRLALIPSRGQEQVLTYEFLGSSATGDQVLSYINTQTGAEQELLLLVETPEGTLTK